MMNVLWKSQLPEYMYECTYRPLQPEGALRNFIFNLRRQRCPPMSVVNKSADLKLASQTALRGAKRFVH